MKHNLVKLTLSFLFVIFHSTFVTVEGQTKTNNNKVLGEPIHIEAPELEDLNFNLPTGGLKIVSGLETYYVIRSNRWVTVSFDNGKAWLQPIQPQSLITGMGKVWGQATSDGRYALIYNPDFKRRWPLIMLTSDDGIIFNNPLSLNGDFPKMRYEGLHKDSGISYHRGLSKWNNDGSIKDNALWLVYSLNKEDICVIRVPLI